MTSKTACGIQFTIRHTDNRWNTNRNSQTAVLFSVDKKIVMFLSKTAPDTLTHTETKPTASFTIKGSTNPTNGPARDTCHCIGIYKTPIITVTNVSHM